MSDAIETQLVTHIQDAHAMEENILRMLDDLVLTTEIPQLEADFRHHRTETERQIRRLESRLAAHHQSRSLLRDALAIATAVAKMPIDLIRPQPTARNIRDAYATEHAEIAAYELLERVAQLAGDTETAKVAKQNRDEEIAMAKRIEANWDRAAEQALGEAGVAVIEIPGSRSSGASGNSSSRSRSGSSARSRSGSASRGRSGGSSRGNSSSRRSGGARSGSGAASR
jgi:ferritin-like metal-binding protein YciE